MSADIVSKSEDAELENILLQIFMECDALSSPSTTNSMTLIDDEMPISKIVQYIQDQLSTWPIEHMLELCKCLIAASANDRVNLQQFKEATKHWITKVRQMQDDNNNTQKKFYKNTNDTKMNSMKTEMDRDATEVKLRMRVRKFDEENIIMREELIQAEELVTNLERQRNNLENQLYRYTQKYQQLQKENDEQKDKLNDLLKKEKTCVFAFQRSTKEYKILLKQLENAEIEMQAIPSLKKSIEKITKEKKDYIRHIARLQEELYKKEEEYKSLKSMMAELQDTSSNIKETYEHIIRNLREKNHQLTDENAELQSWSMLNGEKLSFSPIPDPDGYCPHSTPYKLEKVSLENSLYAELRASGFTTECSRSLWIQELEEELNQYNTVIPMILEQLQKVIQNFVMITNSTNVPQFNSLYAKDTKANNIETLKHKIAFLLNMVSDEIAKKRNTKDSSTQLRADSDETESLNQFGATSFRALLTRAHQCLKPEAGLRSIASHCASDNKDDPFLKIIHASESIQDCNITKVIDPIVVELDRIIQHTIDSPCCITHTDSLPFENSRYKSIHTLPSNLQLLQPFSLSAVSARQTCNYQSSRTNSLDVSFAQGDGLTEENSREKFPKLAIRSYSVPEQENLPHSEETLSNEISKLLSTLQMDSKELSTVEEANAENLQMPDINNTPVTSPRRKISVYSRSFDIVKVQNSCENKQRSNLEVRQYPSDLSTQDEEKIDSDENEIAGSYIDDRNNTFKYQFAHSYRNTNNNSDSSNSCSPHKQFEDNLSDDEPTMQVHRKIYLAPTRLKLAQEIGSKFNRIVEVFDKNKMEDSTPDSNPCKSDKSSFSIVDNDTHRKDDNVPTHSSSTFIIDKYDADSTIFESNSCSVNEEFPRKHMMSIGLTPHDQTDSAKIANLDGPHSQRNMQRIVDSDQLRVERSVDSQMSNCKDTPVGSDSECEPTHFNNQYVDEKITTDASKTSSAVSFIGSASSTKIPCENTVQNDGKARNRNLLKTKQERRQRRLIVRKAFSEDETSGRRVCRCRQSGYQDTPLLQIDNQCRAFPSLTSVRLQESGIAILSDTTETINKENLNEFELQRKYTAFSLCLCTDRVTLPQRMELSLRQRDQSEKNFSSEVQKMQRDIQELAPLCMDRESLEKVERVRHQLDMIAHCVHRVSCTAETLGAVHQEYRISRAVLLADQYLQLLQSRCEKLTASIVETKRILIENNIVIEENSNELVDDLPRIRYRSGTPANNRMMMARRRASVATMSRPMGSTQDITKDIAKQRNSVSGRVTLRRPSLSYESPKWETEKLDRTDSTSSISELRNIFEHIESRRSSKEENNNMLRLSQSNSQNIINFAIVDNEIWTNPNQGSCSEFPSIEESTSQDCRPCARWLQPFRLSVVVSWRIMLWGILLFFFGFCVNYTISMMNICNINGPLNQWSIEGILQRYGLTRNIAPHPI